MNRGWSRFVLLLVLAGLGVLVWARPSGGFHLLKTVRLSAAPGGREYFDYIAVDGPARRIYLSHGTEFKVLDADSYAEAGAISGLKRCHGVALVKSLSKGFITDGDAGEVVVFDLKTLKVTGRIKTEHDADGILYDPASERVFAFNGDPHDVSVIDPAKQAVVKTIPLGGGPEFGVADARGTVFDNNEDTSEVVVIDSRNLTIKARWPIAPAGHPASLAIDREHRRLFIGGRNPQMLAVMDADNGKVIQSFPIGAGVDANVYDPETGLIFCSTRQGTLHVFHEDSPDKFSEVETVKTEVGAKTMGLDLKTHHLFLDTADVRPSAGGGRPSFVPGTFHLLVYGR